jgi:hypothetical protein
MSIFSHLGPCVCTQSPKYLEMAQGHISLSPSPSAIAVEKWDPSPSNRAYALGGVSTLVVGDSTRSLGVARSLAIPDWITEHPRLLIAMRLRCYAA